MTVLAEMGLVLSILNNINSLRNIFINKIKHGERISESLLIECKEYIDKTLEGLEVQKKAAHVLNNIVAKYGLATSLRMQYDKILELTTHGREEANSSDDNIRKGFWESQNEMHNVIDEIESGLIKPIQYGTLPFVEDDLKKDLRDFVEAFLKARATLQSCLNQVKPSYAEYLQHVRSTKNAALEFETRLKSVADEIIINLGMMR